MTSNDLTLTPDVIMTGERLYAEAIDIVFENAQNELLIFDQDLSHGEFSSLKKFEAIKKFLSANSTSRLIIILQSTHYFYQHCPRLFNLLTTFGHKMTVFETNETAKHAKDCFILADGQHYIKRIHIDQARFKYALNDVQAVEQLNSRFQDLLEATHEPVSATSLGLSM